MEDEQSEQRVDWDSLVFTLGTGYLARWDQHDPDALEQEVGPMTRERAEERELEAAWFG